MNAVRTTVRKGFTLVEILIVVVILGILAAIVIPQFSSASQAAKASSLSTQLQSIRSQLELYQLQHNANYPDQASVDFWRQLTTKTNIDGDVPTATEDSYGPYLQKNIKNPFTAVDTIVAGTPSATSGWVYTQATGDIFGVVSTQVQADTNLDDGVDGDVITY